MIRYLLFTNTTSHTIVQTTTNITAYVTARIFAYITAHITARVITHITAHMTTHEYLNAIINNGNNTEISERFRIIF